MTTASRRQSIATEIQYIRDHFLSAGDLSYTEKSLWQSRIEELEDELQDRDAEVPTYASVTLVFDGETVVDQRQIDAHFASQSIDLFQRLVTAQYAKDAARAAPQNGRVVIGDRSKLYVQDVVRGSFGFLLAERHSDQAEAFPTPLQNSVTSAIDIIHRMTNGTVDEFDQAVSETTARYISAVKTWTKLMKTNNTSVSIQGAQLSVELDYATISSLYDRLSSMEVTETEELVIGKLLGILPEKNEFEILTTDSGEVIRGDVGKDVLLKYLQDSNFAARYLQKVVAANLKKISTGRAGQVPKVDYTLEDVNLVTLSIEGKDS